MAEIVLDPGAQLDQQRSDERNTSLIVRPAWRAGRGHIRPICSLLMAILCSSVSGCSGLKVKLPASDPTPPTLVWNVFNQETRAEADHAGNPIIQVKRGDPHRIILKANDPEGVNSIQLNPGLGSGELSWQCHSPPGGDPLAQNKTATLASSTQNLSPDSDGMVLTSIFLLQDLSFAMECQSGWSFVSGNGQLTGRASNYFGGVTTSVIKFVIIP